MDRSGLEGFEGTDRYVIQRLLGRGGFGVVYQAFDRQQNTVVAVKTLHRASADALYHFKREFRGLADITPRDLVRLRAAARQLAEGLCALHQANALHRDVKPSNVLVTREGRVVILDFGLMADMSAAGSGQVNAAGGTPAYMSPEQCAGLPAAQ